MTSLVSYSREDGDLTVSLAHQQQLMTQLLQGTVVIQGQLSRRLYEQEQQLDEVRSMTAESLSRLRKLEMASSLITINMLDTMLNAGWSEREKNKIGVQLASFSRKHHVEPTKVAHPSLPGGVNGYQPGIVKAWIEEGGDFDVPLELRYVD